MTNEVERIQSRPDSSESPGGMGTVRFIVSCNGNAISVLELAKNTLLAALRLKENSGFDEKIWANELPQAFVANCRSRHSQVELDMEMEVPVEQRAKLQQNAKWSVFMFMNSFREDILKRHWAWWDAIVLDENHIAVAVEVSEWPFPSESLRWLFRGSGAIAVDPEL